MNGSVLAADLKAQLYRRYQRLLDRTAIHPYLRWGALAGVLVVYTLRVMALQGWYIVTYGLGIYMLNLLIGFMTPQVRCAAIPWLVYCSHPPSHPPPPNIRAV